MIAGAVNRDTAARKHRSSKQQQESAVSGKGSSGAVVVVSPQEKWPLPEVMAAGAAQENQQLQFPASSPTLPHCEVFYTFTL